MITPSRRRTDDPREHIRGWRPLANLLLSFAVLYGLVLLMGWLS